MSRSLEEHAENWDLRHEDFNDNDCLYDVYRIMREKAPFSHIDEPFLGATPGGAWVATRYEECCQILRDWQHFSSRPPSTENAPLLTGLGEDVIHIDPPRQQKVRKVLNPYFSPGRMKQLEPQIRSVTDELIDTFIERGSGDLAHVAWRQPGTVFFKYVLGMPVTDVPLVTDLAGVALNGDGLDNRLAAMADLYQHVRDTIEARSTQPPQDDLIDVLLGAEIDGEQFPFDSAVANVMLLVQAGLETTASAMSFALHFLGTHPEERDRFVRQPGLVPAAVEEFIRFAGSIHGLHRTVTEEVELSGHTFQPGETIVVNYAAANRDAEEFPDADRCILDREINRHIGFGAGVHRCLGSNLARLEFRIGLEQVLSRMPDFAVPPDAEAIFRGNSVTRGYHVLPVVFTPGERLP